MSDAKAQARQRAIDYLVQLLQMNPVHEGAEIIAARNDALGLKKKTAAQPAAPIDAQKADRRKLLDRLEALRRQFWTLPLDALHKQLNALDGQGFADLESAVARLRVVAAHRAKFPPLAQHADFDGELFSSLKEILTRSPRDTAVLREQVLSKFRNRAHRKRGRKMIALLQRELPAIYAIEADWFDTLYRQKAQLPTIRLTSKSGNNATPVGSGATVRSYWWVLVLGSMVLRACATAFDHHDGANRSRSAPNYDYRPPSVREYRAPAAPQWNSDSNLDTRPNGEVNPRMNDPRTSPRFGTQKDVWQPYPTGDSSEPAERPRPLTPPAGGAPFAQPRYVNPHVPSTGPNVR